jgi:hypothetical protein
MYAGQLKGSLWVGYREKGEGETHAVDVSARTGLVCSPAREKRVANAQDQFFFPVEHTYARKGGAGDLQLEYLERK